MGDVPLSTVTDWDTRHGAPIRHWDAVASLRLTDEPRQRHVVRPRRDGDLPLDGLVLPRGSDTLIVSLHGALDRSRYDLPRFERLVTLSARPQESQLYLSDTTLGLTDDLNLGWYVGTESFDLKAAYATYISTVAEQAGATRIALVGISGGGFASLALAHALPSAAALAFSPQTRIGAYQPWAYERLIEAAFPSAVSYEAAEVRDPWRFDLRYPFSLRPTNGQFWYVQNAGDTTHMSDHFRPFAEALGVSDAGGTTASGLGRFLVEEHGPGHRAPSPERFGQLLDELLAQC